MLMQNLKINRFSFRKTVTISAVCALSIAPVVLSANAASAQASGLQGSYVGVGIGAGVTDDGREEGGDGKTFGGVVQGRLAIPNTPVSLRGAVLFGGDATALMPMLTFDVPVAKNTNVYLGGGYSFVTDDGKATQLGNQDSVVLTTGVETGVGRNVVVFGDVKWGIDAYEDSSKDAVSLQLGVGYRF
jgi:hypothetical protein